MLASMKPGTGRVGVVMPHGVLFRGGAEGAIRQCLIESDEITSAWPRPPPQPPHTSGRCSTTTSGSATRARVAPGSPGCLPGGRLGSCDIFFSFALASRRRSARLLRRSSCFALSARVSDDGGRPEFCESRPASRSNPAILVSRTSTSPLSAVFSVRSRSISASRAAVRSSGRSATPPFYPTARGGWWMPPRSARSPLNSYLPEQPPWGRAELESRSLIQLADNRIRENPWGPRCNYMSGIPPRL